MPSSLTLIVYELLVTPLDDMAMRRLRPLGNIPQRIDVFPHRTFLCISGHSRRSGVPAPDRAFDSGDRRCVMRAFKDGGGVFEAPGFNEPDCIFTVANRSDAPDALADDGAESTK